MQPLPAKTLISIFDSLNDNRTFMCYFGSVSFSISNHLINTLKENLEREKVERTIFKRVYSSFVECLENITRHTTKNLGEMDKLGIVNVSKNEEHIIVQCGNLVENVEIAELIRKMDSIQNKNYDQLKIAYREQLATGRISERGGAGLGILQIAMNSHGNFSYTLQKVDDHKSFFLLEIRIRNVVE